MGAAEEIKMYNIRDVEIFSIGKWNDDVITAAHLDSMVRAYHETRGGWMPYLKLGHDDKQKFANDSGLPALGWVSGLRIRGSKLIADFESVPEKVYKAICAKMYRKVSCEVYYNLEFNGQKYPAFLSGVALLGAEQPGVMNLDDILGKYSVPVRENPELFAILSKPDTVKGYSHTFELANQEDESMADAEKVAELEQKLEAQKKEFALSQEKQAASDKEVEELRKFKLESEAREMKAQLEAAAAKKAEFITKLESKKLVTKATRPLIEQLLSDKQEFSLADKKASKEEVFEQVLKLTREAGKVNFDESSQAEYAKQDKSSKEDAMDKKILKYASDNKCDYATAYKAIAKMGKSAASDDEGDN